jgi:methionine-R-sulfoxide reductase
MIVQRIPFALSFSVLLLTAAVTRASDPASKSKPEEKKMSTPAPAPQKKYTAPSDEELRKKLTPLQYSVARESDTERPFTNEYWKTAEEGIYVSIVTGEPLFSSKDKFLSECGWPAFSKPINDAEIKELVDKSFGSVRTEVRSKNGDAHLGHVFDDGPQEKGGKRYCINSASLRFIPKAKMAEAGYADFLKIFESDKK